MKNEWELKISGKGGWDKECEKRMRCPNGRKNVGTKGEGKWVAVPTSEPGAEVVDKNLENSTNFDKRCRNLTNDSQKESGIFSRT